MYSLLLFLRLALVCGPLLFVCIQLRLPVHLVVGEEEDVLGLILHAPQVCFHTFLLPLPEMWDRYIFSLGVLWFSFRREA